MILKVLGDITPAVLDQIDEPLSEVIITSEGGDAYTGLAIYDLVQKDPEIKTLALGYAGSAAAIVWLAADAKNRFISRHGRIMVHKSQSEINATVDAVFLRAELAEIEAIDKQLAAIVKPVLTSAQYAQFLAGEDVYVTAHELVGRGHASYH